MAGTIAEYGVIGLTTSKESGLTQINLSKNLNHSIHDKYNIYDMYEELHDLDSYWIFSYTQAAMFILILVVAMIGNLLVILVISFTNALHIKTSVFILNLAACDLCMVTFNTPFSIFSLFNNRQWLLGSVMCDIVGSTKMFFCLASISSLMMISIERYVTINNPLNHSVLPVRTVVLMVAISWIVPLNMALLPVFGFGKYAFSPGKCICAPVFPINSAYTCLILIGGVCCPLVVMCVMYIYISKTAMLQARKGTVVCDSNHCSFVTSWRQEMKCVRVLSIITGVFVLCWAPYTVINLWSLTHKPLPLYANAISQWLALLSGALNPWMYSLLNRSFRKGMKLQWKHLKIKLNFGSGRIEHDESRDGVAASAAAAEPSNSQSLKPPQQLSKPCSCVSMRSAFEPERLTRKPSSEPCVQASHGVHDHAMYEETLQRVAKDLLSEFSSDEASGPVGFDLGSADSKNTINTEDQIEEIADSPDKAVGRMGRSADSMPMPSKRSRKTSRSHRKSMARSYKPESVLSKTVPNMKKNNIDVTFSPKGDHHTPNPKAKSMSLDLTRNVQSGSRVSNGHPQSKSVNIERSNKDSSTIEIMVVGSTGSRHSQHTPMEIVIEAAGFKEEVLKATESYEKNNRSRQRLYKRRQSLSAPNMTADNLVDNPTAKLLKPDPTRCENTWRIDHIQQSLSVPSFKTVSCSKDVENRNWINNRQLTACRGANA